MRATRSTTRIFEDVVEQPPATAVPSSADEPRQPERAPLGDITNSMQNETIELIAATIIDDLEKQPKQTPRNTNNISVIPDSGEQEDELPQVLEDDDESETSSAAEEACRELLRPTNSPEVYRLQVRHPDRTKTPASKAVKRARKQLSSKAPPTPRFDPNVHKSPRAVRSPTRAECESNQRRDSFLDEIISRSPIKAGRSNRHPTSIAPRIGRRLDGDKDPQSPSQKGVAMDSPFGSPITAANSSVNPMDTSQKRKSRIEDSFDALDAMEDMLDEVKESLACVNRPRTASSSGHPPELRRLQAQHANGYLSKSAPQTPRGRSSESLAIRTRTQERLPMRISNDSPRRTPSLRSLGKPMSTVSGNRNFSRPSMESMKDAKHVTKPVDTPNKRKPVVTSVQNKPFIPTKSVKPPTLSTFKLPGEAVSARIKAQREARAAAAATSVKSSTKETTARPVKGVSIAATSTDLSEKRRSTGPEIRMTATALARMQIAKGEKPALSVQKTRQAIKPTPPTTSASSATGRTRAPVTRATAPTLSTAARTTATRSAATGAARASVAKPATSTVAPTASQNTKADANNAIKRSSRPVSGIFSAKIETGLKRTPSTRSMTGQPAAKKQATTSTKSSLEERAEAAKRARAEAAERGRQASREWAERARKRNSVVIVEKPIDIENA